MSTATRSGPAAGPAVVGIVALAVVAAIVRASRPLLSGTDPFWHYDLGRRIIADGLPRTDPYSFLRDGQEWILNQWGSEVLFGVVDAVGGLPLLAVFAAVLVGGASLATGWMMWRRAPSLISMLLLGAVILASMSNWSLRGNLLTFVVLPFFVGELLRANGPRPVVTLPLLVLWANLHAAFLLGVALLIVRLLGTWVVAGPLEAAWLRKRGLILTVGALLAGMVTPYGPRFLASTLQLTTRAGGAGISEWTPAPLTRVDVLPYTILIAIVLVALALTARREDLPEILMAVMAALFGATAIRNLATASIVVGIIGAPYVTRALLALRERPEAGPRPLARLDRMLAVAVGLLGLVAIAVTVPRADQIAAHTRDDVPLALIRQLDALDGDHRVVTTSTWSGPVSALTGDHVRTAVDGRLELFSDEEIQTVRDLESANPGWETTLATWCATTVLVPKDLPLDHALEGDAAWHVVDTTNTEPEARLWSLDEAAPCLGPVETS